MKILVTGFNGQLGYDIVKAFEKRNVEVKGIDIEDLEITNELAVRDYLINYNPTHVIHCAAYTAVDKAEEDVERCTKVNVAGTRYIAQVCRVLNIPMMYFSTDYVFDGKKETPYDTTDHPNPTSVYGLTKYKGEVEVRNLVNDYFIVRISWVFGANGNNFVKTMLRLAETNTEINIVEDQVGSPTYTNDIAELTVALIERNAFGLYHATNEGTTNWADFARYIFEVAGKDVVVKGIPTSGYPTKAKRPSNSTMSKESLIEKGFALLPTWQDATTRYIKQLKGE